MLNIGMDVHLKRTSLCVLDQNGKTLSERTIRGSWDKVIEEVIKVKQEYHERITVCFEASGGAGHLFDQLDKICDRVVVAHPGRTRLIFQSKRKNDRIDAQKLAKLVFLGEVPPVYMPGPQVRAWRQMIEHRDRLVKKRTRVKNEIRSLLHSQGVKAPYKLWNKAGLVWLSGLELESFPQLKLNLLLEELTFHQQSLRVVEKELARHAGKNPAVALLMTIPGVGIRTAECLVAYIDDPRRFGKPGEAASYFGLIPSLDSSAGKDRLGHITKQGPATARRLLVEAAWFAVRRSPSVKARFDRLVGNDPDRRKIAIVAIAHYLVRVSLSMLKSGECWREAA